MLLIGLLMLLGVLLPAAAAGLSPGLQQEENRAGLVIRFAEDDVRTACVDLGPTGELSGEEVLRAAGFSTSLEFDPGAGAAVCKIEDTGCDTDQEPCFCECTLAPDTDCIYWSYYQLQAGQWQVSNLGASSTTVRPGNIEGWSWSVGEIGAGGIAPPIFAFDNICPARLEPTLTSTLPPPARLLPSFTPTPDPRFPTATFTPSPTATNTAIPKDTATATATGVTPSATATRETPTATLVTPTTALVTPTMALVTPTTALVTPTTALVNPPADNNEGDELVAAAPPVIPAVAVTATFAIGNLTEQVGATVTAVATPPAAAAAGTAVVLMPLVGDGGRATAAIAALEATAPPAATAVVAAPQMLPTAGPIAGVSEGGLDAGYFVFFLIVIVLAGIIVVLNMRRTS
jgi:hypothetical protein